MVRGAPDEGTFVPLSGGMTMMGRATLNDVVLEEPGVSRQHAGIRGDFVISTVFNLVAPTPSCTGYSWSHSRP
jgi:hypothetical protein